MRFKIVSSMKSSPINCWHFEELSVRDSNIDIDKDGSLVLRPPPQSQMILE